MAWWLPAITAGVGLLQGMQKDKQSREQAKIGAEQNRYAPLFGQSPGRNVSASRGSAIGDALAGGLGGMQTMMNYNMMQAAMNKAAGAPQPTSPDLAMNMRNPYDQMLAGSFVGNPADPDELTG